LLFTDIGGETRMAQRSLVLAAY